MVIATTPSELVLPLSSLLVQGLMFFLYIRIVAMTHVFSLSENQTESPVSEIARATLFRASERRLIEV
jgi:hypothetical protein